MPEHSSSNAPVERVYVSALCEALLRFQSSTDLRGTDVDQTLKKALITRSLNTLRDGLSTFADDLETLGPPPIDGGDQLLAAWRSSLDEGVQAIDARAGRSAEPPDKRRGKHRTGSTGADACRQRASRVGHPARLVAAARVGLPR